MEANPMTTSSLGTKRAYTRMADERDTEYGDGDSYHRRGLAGWFDNLQAQTKGLITFALIFAMMGAQSIFAYRTSVASQHSADWVAHTTQVLGLADSGLGDTIDMQAGVRGFYITGKDDFLAPYTAGQT